jgi:hypothetical protein
MRDLRVEERAILAYPVRAFRMVEVRGAAARQSDSAGGRERPFRDQRIFRNEDRAALRLLREMRIEHRAWEPRLCPR